MDPNETLRLLLNARSRQDDENSKELAAALKDWLLQGGFTPQISDYQLRIVLTGYAQHILNM